jgi:hypothetical protein
MTQLAGVIFAGQVVAVRQHEAVGGATGVVEITFAVEDAERQAAATRCANGPGCGRAAMSRSAWASDI